MIETHLTVRAGLEGSCDLYDADRATVIDHKVIGSTNLRNYRINGPSEQYRVQAHAYGMAYTQLGLPVAHVALAFYPRSSDLSNLHVWTQPYDPNVVIAALDRHDTLIDLICALDVEHAPDRYRLIPATPSHRCGWCPWFKPGPDTGATCPGATNVTAPAA